MNSLKSKNNAKFLLQYHIILVCKYRQKLFVNTEIKNKSKSNFKTEKPAIVFK